MMIPLHVMQTFVLQCIASGLPPRVWATQQGLTREQGARLTRLVKERIELSTSRLNPEGSILTDNHARTLSRLSCRMVTAMLGTGERACEQLERLNRRYTPVKRRGKMVSRQIESKDLPVYKFAWQTCERIVALSRKDGRDEPPIKPEDVPAMVQAVADRGPMAGTLTVIDAGGAEVKISE